MRERPILFSGPMVRAILDGRKTQTRRVVKKPSDLRFLGGKPCFTVDMSPYGMPGDRLWVRETWSMDSNHEIIYRATANENEARKVSRWWPSIHMYKYDSRITMEVTGVRIERVQDISESDICAEMGAPATWDGEGLEPYKRDLRGAFANLWDSINGKRAGCDWNSNPWVWAITFKRVMP